MAMAYALLPSKTIADYIRLFKIIRDAAESRDMRIKWKVIMSDFEQALYTATKKGKISFSMFWN